MAYTQLQLNFIGFTVLFLILTTSFCAARVLSCRMRGMKLGADDWLAIFAQLFYYGEVGVHLWGMISAGVGKHISQVTPEMIVISFKQLTTVEYPYAAAITLIRVSISIFLLRVFSVAKWFRWSVYLAIFTNVCWGLFVFIDAAVICQPFEMNWNPTIPGGHCGNKTEHFVVIAVWGIINDLILWGLPQAVVWRLTMGTTQKLILSGVFALGLFDVVVGIVRIVALVNLTPPPGDWTYSLAPVQIWSFVESGIILIIANVPRCKPVGEALIPRSVRLYIRQHTGKEYRDNSGYRRHGSAPLETIGGGVVANGTGATKRWTHNGDDSQYPSKWGSNVMSKRSPEDDEFELFPREGKSHAFGGIVELGESESSQRLGHGRSTEAQRPWEHTGMAEDQRSLDQREIRVMHDVTVVEERV